MGNAGAKEADNGAGGPDEEAGSDGEPRSEGVRRVGSSDSIDNTPPESPGRSRSPLMFAPQVLSLLRFDCFVFSMDLICVFFFNLFYF